MKSITWTDEDFRIVFTFLRDIRAAMEDTACMDECRALLKSECEEASRRLSRIADACGAFA